MASLQVTVLLLPLVLAIAFADVAYYVPKAFYTIDKFGHESAPVLLFGGLRAKRSAFSTASASSSSSSSSSSGNGYGQTQTFSVSSGSPGYDPYLSQGVPVYQGSYNQPGYQSGHVIYNRFGDEGVTGVGVAGTSTGGNGVFSSSSSVVDSDGKVHYTAQTGKF